MTQFEVMTLLINKFPTARRKSLDTQLRLLEILPANKMISIEDIQNLFRKAYPKYWCPTVQEISGNLRSLRKCGLVERQRVKTGKVLQIDVEGYEWKRDSDGDMRCFVTHTKKDIEEVKSYFKRA